MVKKTSILYESYAFGKQVLAPARVRDSTHTITITLAAGKGVITAAEAFNCETGARINKAYDGQLFCLYLEVTNQGDRDTVWVTAKDADTGEPIKTPEYPDGINYATVIDSGKKFGLTVSNVKMPNKNFRILVEAGHGK